MKIDDVRKAKSRIPFEPFVIRTSDGRELLVKHPDAVSWDEGGRSPSCFAPGGWELLDVAHVVGLAAAPNAGRKAE